METKRKKENETCLVTGGCGFIGSHLVHALHDAGYPVIVVDDLSTGSPDVIPDDVEFIKKDCCDLDTLYGAQYIFHLAARPRIWFSVENPTVTTKANVLATVRMLELCESVPVKRFIYSSSSSVYGVKDEPGCSEDMPLNPMSPYALQKKQAEEHCRMLGKILDIPVVIFRYFNVYGEGMPSTGSYSLVIGKFLEQKRERRPMTIYGDGEQTRDYTHVSDVIRANMLAMRTNYISKDVETFNIGTGVETSVNELARLIGGKKVRVKNPNVQYEERRKYADISKAQKMLSWTPQVTVPEGIELMR